MGFFGFRRHTCDKHSAAALGHKEAAQRMKEAWDTQTIIDRLDALASGILKSHGIESFPREVPGSEQIRTATGYRTYPVWSMRAGTAEEARYAGRLLEALRVVRGFLYSSGSVNDAVILGMRLGIAAEQAGLADEIPMAKRLVKLADDDHASEAIQKATICPPRTPHAPRED